MKNKTTTKAKRALVAPTRELEAQIILTYREATAKSRLRKE
jgi:hypothetical protein